jgi:uncharacterized protein (TIGR00730 family)
MLKTVCVYCGSADHLHPEYLEAARLTGEELARRGITTIYGAGKTGLMGALADGVLRAGGNVTGVVCENLNTPTLIHANLTSLEVVPDIQLRKARMASLAEGFIALPGGFGTFDELFETLTWSQIGLHSKPVGLLNTRGYFNPLLAMVDHALAEHFIFPEHRALLIEEDDPARLLEKMETYTRPDGLERWVDRPASFDY